MLKIISDLPQTQVRNTVPGLNALGCSVYFVCKPHAIVCHRPAPVAWKIPDDE
jgi:hypothetical protein